MPRQPLLLQLQAAVAAAAAARDYFREPSDAAVAAGIAARRKAREAGRAVKDAFRPRRAPARGDWLALGRAFAELAEQAGWAAEESRRFGLEPDERLARMAGQLWRAAQALEAAFGARGERAVESLIEAKKRALDIERMHRAARAEAIDDPRVVRELAGREVAARFSKAAEAVQQAADRMGELLSA